MAERMCILLGDVVDSRKVRPRKGLQISLKNACEKVNSCYHHDIQADFKILKGTDEIGGALSSIANLFRILVALEDSIYPEKIRFVIVLDFIDVGVDSRDVSKMDGPALHLASEYMFKLKKTDLLLKISLFDEVIDSMMEGEINLIFLARAKWTARQRQIASIYEELNSYLKVAEKLGITHQAVAFALKRANWRSLYLIEKSLNESLLRYQQRLSRRENIE